MNLALIDGDVLVSPRVRDLLSLSMGDPTPAALDDVGHHYREDPAWALFGYEQDGLVVGCVSIEATSPGQATLRHLAVAPEERLRGIGRSMIDGVSERLLLNTVVAETDGDAVGFYRPGSPWRASARRTPAWSGSAARWAPEGKQLGRWCALDQGATGCIQPAEPAPNDVAAIATTTAR